MPWEGQGIWTDLRLGTEVASDVDGGGNVLHKSAPCHHLGIPALVAFQVLQMIHTLS